jgi:lysozyme family protein
MARPTGKQDRGPRSTRQEAGAIFRARYWDPIRGDDLPAGVDLAIFDFAVNSGVGTAARALQRAVGAVPDGQIGPPTVRAARAKDAQTVITTVCGARLSMLKGLGTWVTFGKGWSARVAEVRADALLNAAGKAA